MVHFIATIQRFDVQGEKTGWTYIEIPAAIAGKLKPGNRKSFRVSGKLDNHAIEQVALLPMGEGKFIIPLKADIRRAIRKGKGDELDVYLKEDKREMLPDEEFMSCLEEEPKALAYFNTLVKSHQLYYSKWIESAKTEATKAKRIAQAIEGLSRSYPFNIMMRTIAQNKKDLLK